MKLYLTNAGQALLYKAQGGKQLTFTRFGLGNGELSRQAIQPLTNLISEKLAADIVKLEIKTNKVVLGMSFTNAELVEGFYFRELGIFAEDPDTSEEVLYMYANAGETADYIDSKTGRIIEEYLDVEIQVSNVENISAVIDDSLVYLTPKSDISETTAIFEEAGTRENINSSENTKTIFGKIKKFFTDLKSVAFSGSYNDLEDIPTNFTPKVHEHSDYVKKTGDTMTGPLTTTSMTVGSRAEGSTTGSKSFSQGDNCVASGNCSHAEGYCQSPAQVKATGTGAHAEGGAVSYNITASGAGSHAEGYCDSNGGRDILASGKSSHAEGAGCQATGSYTHAEGLGCSAISNCSHVEGKDNSAGSSDSGTQWWSAHAEGNGSTASGYCSHVEGRGCIASGRFQHVFGR